jgi:hypothetical protein
VKNPVIPNFFPNIPLLIAQRIPFTQQFNHFIASAEDRASYLFGNGNQEFKDLESIFTPDPVLSKSFRKDGKL